jgi:hypothetical protein
MISMKRRLRARLLGVAVAGLALGLLVCQATVGAASGALSHPQVVASWPFAPPYGSFAESMTLGSEGNLYVSLTTWGDVNDVGQVVRVTPAGATSPYGQSIDLGYGLLTGLAFHGGDLYVAVAFNDSPGVFRVPSAGSPTQVLALPEDSFPNGIAFHAGYLYVTDSSAGAVWRSDPTTISSPAQPWLQDELLAPGSGPRDHEIGANGIAFSGDSLYVAVADAGRVVKTTVGSSGSAGALRVVLERATLKSADGIAFDGSANLWLTTNGPNHGQVLMLGTNGKLAVVAPQVALDYPTQPVFGAGGTLFVANGSFDGGTPSVVAFP